MYELINKIMEKAEQEKVDVGIAYDMLRTEDTSKELKNASEFLNKNQVAIFKLREKGKEEEIKKLCSLASDKNEVWRYTYDLYEKGVIQR